VSENKQRRNLPAIVVGRRRNGGGKLIIGTDTPTLIFYAAYLRQLRKFNAPALSPDKRAAEARC